MKITKGNDLEISRIFNVSRKAIYDILHNRTWRHVV